MKNLFAAAATLLIGAGGAYAQTAAPTLSFDRAVFVTCRDAHGMTPEARKALAYYLAEYAARYRGVTIPEDQRGAQIGYLVRGGCTLAPDAYLKLAQTHASLVDGPYYDQAATKESITYFTDFMLLFPSDTNIASAEKGLDNMKTMLAESKMRMADFYFYKRSNYKAARVFYNEAITAYPESAIAQRAKNRLAEVEAKASNQPLPPAPGEPAPAPKKKKFFFF